MADKVRNTTAIDGCPNHDMLEVPSWNQDSMNGLELIQIFTVVTTSQPKDWSVPEPITDLIDAFDMPCVVLQGHLLTV